MSDQSKKANKATKGPGKKEEATRPVDGEASGSGGNSSTQNQPASTYTPTTSGGGGNTQETSGQSVMLERHLKEPPRAGYFNDAAVAAAGGRPEVPSQGQRAEAELEISDDEEEEDQPADKRKNKNV
ncbi:hypothetical protein FDENT_9284 [Fusarium denticulatum]|uniref:Uncharacterized protein n=1 Tax=Fusarium denticulatum TaxID=48507 RepID=A0A8H5TTM7_9HYPO|nr:hypothetical protein FDENT_9284 [Fusarium denticulatum]